MDKDRFIKRNHDLLERSAIARETAMEAIGRAKSVL
jgi:hypothetical protein